MSLQVSSFLSISLSNLKKRKGILLILYNFDHICLTCCRCKSLKKILIPKDCKSFFFWSTMPKLFVKSTNYQIVLISLFLKIWDIIFIYMEIWIWVGHVVKSSNHPQPPTPPPPKKPKKHVLVLENVLNIYYYILF